MLSEENAMRMLGEVVDMFEDASSFFKGRRLNRAIEHVAMYRGWHEIARYGGYEMGLTDPQGEANEGVNIARMLVKSSVAQTLKQLPSIEIPAAKDDQRSRAKADMTEKLAKSIMRMIDQDELHRTVSWAKQTGACWFKVCWDINKGKVIPQSYDGFTDKEEEMRYEDDGFGDKVIQPLFEGDVRYEYVPTTDGFPDPSAHTIEEMHHFFQTKLLPIRKLEDRFPTDYFGKSTKGRFSTGNSPRESAPYASIVQDDEVSIADFAAQQSEANVLAELVEFWELPSRQFPRGRLVVYSGSTIISMGPNPYYPTRIPFVLFFGDNIVSGSLYPDGLLEDVKPLQYSTNRVANKMREHLDKMLNAHMLVPRNSGIDKNIWGDKSGQIIEYVKGYKPEPLHVPEIPNSMFSFMENQITRAQQVTGYSDVGRGQAQGDISGRAVAFYTENEQAMREPDMAAHRRSMLQVVQHAVYLYRQYADDGRLIRMVGENGKVELVEFNSEDYDWDYDFVPELYTGRPSSRIAKVSEVLEFMGANLFSDDPSAERARKMLGDEYAAATTYDPFIEDRQRAKRENLLHLRDPLSVLQVQSFDDHKIHNEEHRKYMKTLEFEALPDWRKKALLIHDELHELMGAGADAALLQSQSSPPSTPSPTRGVESPPSGGNSAFPSSPPTIEQFNSMSSSEQASSDQS